MRWFLMPGGCDATHPNVLLNPIHKYLVAQQVPASRFSCNLRSSFRAHEIVDAIQRIGGIPSLAYQVWGDSPKRTEQSR
jgi:hypothetical protein